MTSPPVSTKPSTVFVMVSADQTESSIAIEGDPIVAWYHFTRYLIESGHHASDLIWGVVLAYEDEGSPSGEDEHE
jgi:hypothetical protein